MSSQKSSAAAPHAVAKQPQRARGLARVKTLQQAAADVFAEKGYEAATMTEIAARAKAPVGSLYQFFPSKESIADSLIEIYAAEIDRALALIGAECGLLDIEILAERLLDVMVVLRRERATVMALFDARRDLSARAASFRIATQERVAAILQVRRPELGIDVAEAAAVVVLQAMKTMPALMGDATTLPLAAEQWRTMLRVYLTQLLGSGAQTV